VEVGDPLQTWQLLAVVEAHLMLLFGVSAEALLDSWSWWLLEEEVVVRLALLFGVSAEALV
jgi:hypothetical protein